MALSRVSEYAISLPFRIDDFGGIASTTSQNSIWADRVRSAIGTTLTERVMRPEFGTTIPTELFEGIGGIEGAIRAQVEESFLSFLPTLTLDEVIVTTDDFNGIISAEIVYTLPNRDQTSVSIGIASLTGSSPIQENLL